MTSADLTQQVLLLGAVGLAHWGMSFVVYSLLKRKQTAAAALLIDREYDVVQDSGERAGRLLAG